MIGFELSGPFAIIENTVSSVELILFSVSLRSFPDITEFSSFASELTESASCPHETFAGHLGDSS